MTFTKVGVICFSFLVGCWLTSGVRAYATIDEDGVYRNIKVALDPNLKISTADEFNGLVNMIRTLFIDASKKLYDRSKQATFFGDVNIVIPRSMDVSKLQGQLRINDTVEMDRSFGNSDMYIIEGNGLFKNSPNVLELGHCGKPAKHVELPVAFLRDCALQSNLCESPDSLIDLWYRYRYGVFRQELMPEDPVYRNQSKQQVLCDNQTWEAVRVNHSDDFKSPHKTPQFEEPEIRLVREAPVKLALIVNINHVSEKDNDKLGIVKRLYRFDALKDDEFIMLAHNDKKMIKMDKIIKGSDQTPFPNSIPSPYVLDDDASEGKASELLYQYAVKEFFKNTEGHVLFVTGHPKEIPAEALENPMIKIHVLQTDCGEIPGEPRKPISGEFFCGPQFNDYERFVAALYKNTSPKILRWRQVLSRNELSLQGGSENAFVLERRASQLIVAINKAIDYVQITNGKNAKWNTKKGLEKVEGWETSIFTIQNAEKEKYTIEKNENVNDNLNLSAIATAFFSDASLIYVSVWKSDETIHARLVKNNYPVMNANVKVNVHQQGLFVQEFELFDDGHGVADAVKNDGIYSRYLPVFDFDGLIDISVTIDNNKGSSVAVQNDQAYVGVTGGCCGSELPSGSTKQLEPFVRYASLGTILYSRPTVKVPPSRIMDLHCTEFDYEGYTVTLKWTAPGGKRDHGRALNYIIKAFAYYEDAEDRFDETSYNSFDIDTFYSLNPNAEFQIAEYGKPQIMTLNVTKCGKWGNCYFAIKSNGHDSTRSKVSNVVLVPFKKDFNSPDPTREPNPTPDPKNLKRSQLALIISGALILLILIIVVASFILFRKNKRSKDNNYKDVENEKSTNHNSPVQQMITVDNGMIPPVPPYSTPSPETTTEETTSSNGGSTPSPPIPPKPPVSPIAPFVTENSYSAGYLMNTYEHQKKQNRSDDNLSTNPLYGSRGSIQRIPPLTGNPRRDGTVV